MDLSYEVGETRTPADGKDRSLEVREPTPPPQLDALVEPILEDATPVEGMLPATMSSHRVG
jgi:hypothetical protein